MIALAKCEIRHPIAGPDPRIGYSIALIGLNHCLVTAKKSTNR